VVTDLLPAGLSFISATPSQGTYNNGSGAWTVGNVSKVSSATLTVNATVAIPGVKTNTATVTHLDQKDPIPSNNSAAVTITPQILSLTSGPTATPSIGGIGQNIQFSAAASLAGTTFGWNFGDGSTDTSGNANVSHAFSSAGTFTVTVTATNGTQRVTGTVTVSINGTAFGSGADSNGDGFSDAFDTAFGLNPTDPTQSPVPAGTTAGTLTAAKMSIKLNFAKQASDRLSLSGTLPIPARFNVNSAKIGLSAGDLVEVFTLSSKGKAKSGSNSASVSIKSTKGKVAAQTAKYAIKLNKDNLAADLLASGLVNDNATNKAVTISVGVVLSQANRSVGIVEEGTVPLHYTARKGKTGAAK
jgi:PKD repeat protein